jgi:exportin-T
MVKVKKFESLALNLSLALRFASLLFSHKTACCRSRMDTEIEKIVQAITIASDPTQNALHQQALQYLTVVQQNPDSAWRIALSLFVDVTPEGVRKHSAQVRFYALRIFDDFFDNRYGMHLSSRALPTHIHGRFEHLDNECFRTLQQGLMGYVQSEYVYGSAESEAPCTLLEICVGRH